jgi:phosphatidylserine/phosphatidylglycerophosphate/cardiolipin synthase-like enzyme
MKRRLKQPPSHLIWAWACLVLVLICGHPLYAERLPSEDVQLSFDPDLKRTILDAVNSSQKSLDLEMFKMTDRDVIHALQQAAKRGVAVRVILCPSEEANVGTAKKLLSAGISQLWYPLTKKDQIMHLKMAIFDHQRLLFGSVNWTFTGLTVNHEGLVLIDRLAIVSQAADRFEEDWRASTQQRPWRQIPKRNEMKSGGNRSKLTWE